MKKKILYDTQILAIGIVLNLLFSHIIIFFKIPFLYMDSFGTVLTAVIIGPIYGAVVGILTNVILSLTIEYANLHFALVNMSIGILVGLIARKYDFTNIITSIITGLIIAITSSIMSIIISMILTKGFTNKPIDNFIQMLVDDGNTFASSIIMGTLLSTMLDKIISCLLVTIAIKKIPLFKVKLKINNDKVDDDKTDN